ncbi:Aminotransferase class I and II family protein [Aspergillus niger]|uniref:Aminotransferase class I and II family protein n=1 Tax=Aspergillus niger TaxID=5061 RepID=A0A505IF58_ASPNG|nr:Aminotransferase class I and II family protein [Aspergillus niger]
MGSAMEPRYRLGVDVGGTNTDAVLIHLSPVAIVASHKAPTTPDVTTGITDAVQAVIAAAKVPLSAIGCVIVGTTHFVNAVVQRSPSLRRVAVIRLCGGPDEGFGRNIPPFTDFPLDLRARIASSRPYFCHGGYQISGEEISPLDETELEKIAAQLVHDGISNVVIAGMYAPLNHTQETRAKEVLLRSMEKHAGPSYTPRITLSHEVSGLGFLARENAAILNATLRPLAERTIYGFQKAMEDIFQDTPYTLYLTQNDGSVLSAAEAVHLPIRTFNSGPTNSIRGGEFLWRAATEANDQQQQNTCTEPLVVIDIGGTTSDSGLLLPNGLPQMSSVTSLVGGVRTNFALPAVESIGLGGGSIIRGIGQSDCSVGPDSVAHELLEKARLFGGEYLTATDIAVASAVHGVTEMNPLEGMGDPTRLADIDIAMVDQAQSLMRRKIEELVDRTKIHKDDVDVLIVGGGAPIIRTDEPLLGVRQVQTVKGGEVANAVGAAISRVSGVIDTVVDTSNRTVKEAQEAVCAMATEKAIGNGARPDTVQVAEVTMLPIQYVDAKARIVVRAVGQLDVVAKSSAEKTVPIPDEEEYLKAKAYLHDHPGTVRIISPDTLPDDALVGWTGCMGSPEVSMERLENSECLQAHDELMRVTDSPPVSAFLALEIGGGNGMVNLGVAAHYSVPCLDADYMGRAYPTMWQVTPNVYGSPRGEALLPAAIASGDGSFMTMTRSRTDRLVDKTLRAAVVEMGCRAGSAGPPHRAGRVRQQAIRNTVSLAWWIGRAVCLEKNIADKAMRIVEAAGGPESGAILGEGKVISVSRVLKTGHSYGVLEINGQLSDGRKATLNIPFKNENAYVEAVLEDGEKKILAAVPDLIVVLDAESGAGLGTPEFKYGLKVVVLAIAASPRWTDTPRGMELGGPKSMGFEEVEYVPIGKYCEPRSVIDVFGGL